MSAQFGIGDKVKIVKYGHLIWASKSCDPETRMAMTGGYPKVAEDDDATWHDMAPHLVGKKCLVTEVTETQGTWKYALEIEGDSHAWFSEGQLEMINKNPNR